MKPTDPLTNYKLIPGLPHDWRLGELEMSMMFADVLEEILTDWDSWEMGLLPTMAAHSHYFESNAMTKALRFKKEGCRFTFDEFLEVCKESV